MLRDCSFISNSARTLGGALYNLGIAALSSCSLISNSADHGGGIIYAEAASAISFFSCSFNGDYSGCAIEADGGALEFYYTQSFPAAGTVCSASTNAIVLYNNDAVVPVDSSYGAGVLSCQHESIGLYCAFDCAVGLGGVGIQCR